MTRISLCSPRLSQTLHDKRDYALLSFLFLLLLWKQFLLFFFCLFWTYLFFCFFVFLPLLRFVFFSLFCSQSTKRRYLCAACVFDLSSVTFQASLGFAFWLFPFEFLFFLSDAVSVFFFPPFFSSDKCLYYWLCCDRELLFFFSLLLTQTWPAPFFFFSFVSHFFFVSRPSFTFSLNVVQCKRRRAVSFLFSL